MLASDGNCLNVSLCNHGNMTSLAGRLRRLRDAVGPRLPPSSLVLVRHPSLPLPKTARRTQQYLDELSRQGARFLQPSEEAFAALAVLREMLAEAQAGDLHCSGETLSPETAHRWLSEHVSPELRQLLDELLGAPGAVGVNRGERHRDLGNPCGRAGGIRASAGPLCAAFPRTLPVAGRPSASRLSLCTRGSERAAIAMARLISVCDVREGLYRAAGGPEGAGSGEASTALLGQWFHEAFAALISTDPCLSLETALAESRDDVKEQAARLKRHVFVT